MQVTLMVDGSFCPVTGAGGFGYWIATYRGKLGGGGPIQGTSTNATEVEMKSICNSLVVAVNKGLAMAGDVVLVQTDSKSSISAFEGRRIPGAEGERKTIEFLNQYKVKAGLTIVFRYVKGHSKEAGARFAANNHCDERAKKAMRKVRHELRKGSEIVQAASGTECGSEEAGNLQDLRSLRIPRTDVCGIWKRLCAAQLGRGQQC